MRGNHSGEQIALPLSAQLTFGPPHKVKWRLCFIIFHTPMGRVKKRRRREGSDAQHLFSASAFNVSVSVCLCKSVCDCCGLDKAIDNRHNTSTTLLPRPKHAHKQALSQHLLISSRSHAVVVFVSFSISAPCDCFKHSLDYSKLRQLHEKDFVVIAMREHYANIKTDFSCASPSPFPFPVLSPSPFPS